MKYVLLTLGLLTGWSWAAPTYHQEFRQDLDGDGKSERIVLKVYSVADVTKGQLVVMDSKGKALWSSPKLKDPYADSPWSFLGEFDLGDISWVGDYDGDGRVDLCATEQKSDVRPTVFKLYHWNGRGFVFDRKGMLVAAPQKPATFIWTPFDGTVSEWIDSLERNPQGKFEAKLLRIPQGSEKLRLHFSPGQGFIREN